jgi:hypothetical protein
VGAQRSMGMTEYSVPRAPQCTPATQPLVRMQPAGLPRDAHHAPHAPCIRAREATRQRKCKQQSWGVPRSGAARPAGGGGASCHSPIGQPRAHIMDVLLGAQTRLPPALHMSRRHRQPAPREAPRVSPGAQVASYRPLVIRGPRKRPQPISRPLRSLHGLCPSLAFPPTIFLRNPQRATPKLFKTSGIYSLP